MRLFSFMQVGKEKGRSRQEQRGKGGLMHLSLFLPTLGSGVYVALTDKHYSQHVHTTVPGYM